MKTVLFLGAGATRAEYCATKEVRLQEILSEFSPDAKILPPPVDGDFVSLAHERCANNFPCVRAYSQTRFNCDLISAHLSGGIWIGMEWLFSRIFEDAMAKDASLCAKTALHNLLTCYRKLIAISTIPLTDDSVMCNSPLKKLLKPLDDLCIITTNQDLLVENLLYGEPSPGSIDLGTGPCAYFIKKGDQLSIRRDDPGKGARWPIASEVAEHMKQGPRFPLQGMGADDVKKLSQIYGLKTEVERISSEADHVRETFCAEGFTVNTPKILKLHGSLNWWYESKEPNDPTPLENPKNMFFCCERYIRENERLIWASEKNDKLYPFVVPPVPNKHRYFDAVLKPVWNTAKEELGKCERLIVYGYGFPKTDKEARALFTRKHNGKVKKVHIINTDDGLPDEIRDLRTKWEDNRATVAFHESVDKYLQSLD